MPRRAGEQPSSRSPHSSAVQERDVVREGTPLQIDTVQRRLGGPEGEGSSVHPSPQNAL